MTANGVIKFGKDNAKLKALRPHINTFLAYLGIPPVKHPKVYTFSKLSGHTCPFARNCLSKAVKGADGKVHIADGPHTVFRCFSASQETIYPNVYTNRERNTQAIESGGTDVYRIAALILFSLPDNANIVRIHVGGDFKTQPEFDAWIHVAKCKPNVLFYAYTKSLPFWIKRLDDIPPNFILTASYGGFKDRLIAEHNLRYVKVVNSIAEANGLPIDHDDTHAANPATAKQNFALLVHGIQPAGSIAGKAVKALNGVGSYGKRKLTKS